MAIRRVLDRKNSRRAPNRRRLVCESLEDRRVLSITVDTLADVVDANDGVTSLREAVQMANTAAGADTIDFSVTGTITLDSTLGELLVSDDLTISGPGRDDLTIDGQQNSRLFNFDAGGTGDLEVSGVSLINGQVTGFEETGGAINFLSTGTLTIADSRISGNSTRGNSSYGVGAGNNSYLGGGAIFSSGGGVAINDSELSNNYTYGDFAPGGAVNTNGGDLTVANSTITGNSTMGIVAPGGALFAYSGVVQVTDSTLTMNRVEGDNYASDLGVGGGAIAGFLASVTVDGSDVSDNTVAGSLSSGGGIGTFLGAITVRQSTINDNTLDRPSGGGALTAGGAGLSSNLGNILIEDSSISGNTNSSIATQGGGVYAGSGDITVLRSTIAGNSTTTNLGRGGGISSESGDVTVTNSTISGNSTLAGAASGGGIALRSGDLAVINSTLSGNTAGNRGGGVFSDAGDITINNSTVTGNTSSAGAGGITLLAFTPLNAAISITNSVLAGNINTAPGVADDAVFGNDFSVGTTIPDNNLGTPIVNVNFSLISDNTGTTLTASATPDADGNLIGGTGASAIDPLIGALADNGGPTLTHLPETGSPLIDAGDPAFDPNDPSSPSTDQRGAGFARVAGGRLDIGAVEVPSDGVLGDYNSDTVVNAADFVVWRDLVGAPAASFPTVDGDGSETIDLGDFDVWAENFGGSSGSQAAAAAAQPVEAASLLAAIPTDAAAGYTSKTFKTVAGGPAETPITVSAADALLLLSGINVVGEPGEDSTPSQTEPGAESETGNDQAAEEAFAQLAVVF